MNAQAKSDNKRKNTDEFYTQRKDIEKELSHYDVHFRDKVVYCNCDDPRVSEFYLYFKRKFHILGLKKLIASTYRNPDPETRRVQADLIAEDAEKYEVKRVAKASQSPPSVKPKPAVWIEYTGGKTGRPRTMKGDAKYHGGDFRSKESIALLQQANVVVTNPPFSLFAEYVRQLIQFKKDFIIIGPIQSISNRDIFPLIKQEEMWLGTGMGRWISGFIVPESYKLYGTEARIENGNRIISPNDCLWFTNLDHKKRHADLLVSKRYYGNEEEYPRYDNYDAIEVGQVKLIPRDYAGVMGVPVSFLDKFNPDQFEIIGHTQTDDKSPEVEALRTDPLRKNRGRGILNGKVKRDRILIRHKRPVN